MGSLIVSNNNINSNTLDSDFLDAFFERSFFNDFWGPVGRAVQQHRELQITESENDYQISLAAPGVEKKDFNVTVENGTIILGYDASNSENSFANVSKYNKSYSIPTDCDIKKISASHTNGVLKVSIGKSEKAKPRQIKII